MMRWRPISWGADAQALLRDRRGASWHRHHGQRRRPLHAERAIEAMPGARNRGRILECRARDHTPKALAHLDLTSDCGAPERVTHDTLAIPHDHCGQHDGCDDEPRDELSSIGRWLDTLVDIRHGVPHVEPVHGQASLW